MRIALYTSLLLTVAAPPATAREGFFWTGTEGTLVRADYLVFSTADFKDDSGDLGGERSVVVGQYRFGGEDAWAVALGHEYNALDIDLPPGLAPQTNGDLHTLHAAAHWSSRQGPGELRLGLAPALSVSSNGLKNPDQLDSDAWQLWASAIYAWSRDRVDWILGAAHDFRFGESRLYPIAGVEWTDENRLLRLTYPDILVQAVLGDHWQLAFATAPDGNEWWAYDRDLETPDEFRSEAWRSELSLNYRFDNGLRLGVSAGYRWDTQWQFRREDGGWARLDSDSAAFYGIHLGWYRPGDLRAKGS